MSKQLLTIVFTLLMSLSALAQDTSWEDLTSKSNEFNDPFLSLTSDQLYNLSIVARYQARDSLSESEKTEYNDLLALLESESIDVDYLLERRQDVTEHRKHLAMQPNIELKGKLIKIPGFVTPVEFDGDKVVKFFLVPTAGACIHTPPPPPNQIVLVDYPQGLTLTSLQDAFFIEGKLKIEAQKQKVNYSDGATMVNAVYMMSADKVTRYN
ncbi:DUF3299 domain-containing protein [Photobacterium marinum]|uniref:DUF3299 domain-containing protein n=1 Tax=Photobacterium marinum TaxID=1056511 RepID=UPI000562D430|nr:DUF3299 domain-containing protein [Photobacterium marinum]